MAEVLITLGIIGVVAAMTMPTLIGNYQKQKTVTQLKKAYSELSQAVKLAGAEYGTMDGWDYFSMPETDEPKAVYLIKNYILKHLNTVKVCVGLDNMDSCSFDGNIYYLRSDLSSKLLFIGKEASIVYAITSSGYGILFQAGGDVESSAYNQHLHFYVDINGPKQGKQIIGKDIFQMSANFGKQVASGSYENRPKKSGFWMFGTGWEPQLTRDELINGSGSFICKLDAPYAGRFCGALIQADGWQISPDYPW